MLKNVFVMLLLAGLLTPAALAQQSGAAKPAKKTVKTMISYKEQLNLSDAQIKEIETALTSYQATVTQQRTTLGTLEQEFKSLVQGKAPLPDIKSKLRQITDTRFQLRYSDVLTSRRVSDALSTEQMAKWREIQQRVRAQK